MGEDYSNLEIAARHRDWQACARILFRLLYCRSAEMQQRIAAEVLSAYVGIWIEKHPEYASISIEKHSEQSVPWTLYYGADQQPRIREFPSNPDPADAEFENALIEFNNGASQSIDHAEHTKHFATAIRSSVLARQINQWLHDFPDQFERWKNGLPLDGPSFLDDEVAAREAESAWINVGRLIGKQHFSSRKFEGDVRLAEAYDDWEKSLL